jgi:curved DNA-binding protein CbpA
MNTVDDFVDYYALLQVGETSSTDEITKAIRTARRTWTKRQAASNPERRQEAELKVKQITEAEQILKDKAKRAQFDQRRANWRPPTAPLSGGDEHRDWPALAKEYLSAQNPHSANYAAREALATNGADHESWWVRAHSSFLMGKPADAEYEFNEAIRLQPQNAEYHFDLGEAFAAQAKWKSALSEYETALGIEPGNPLYKTAIANAYLVNNQPTRALDLMEEVVKAHPEIDFFQFYLAWAIHDTTVQKWSKLKNGKFGITSEAQIDYTIKASKRALAFKFDDAQLRAGLQENLQMAETAQQMKWKHSQNILWYIGGLFVSFCMMLAIGSAPAVGLIGMAGIGLIGWAYYTRHYKPNWKHLADSGAVSKAGL